MCTHTHTHKHSGRNSKSHITDLTTDEECAGGSAVDCFRLSKRNPFKSEQVAAGLGYHYIYNIYMYI